MSKEKTENGKEVKSFKVITIGDSNVGKTSIIRRYIYNVFDDKTMSTIGLSFSFKDVELKSGIKISLKLVDTAGQEKYRSLTKSYFKNSDGVLFVFDYGNKVSFEHIQEWVEMFKENTSQDDIPKYLIGNKDDIENKTVTSDMINEFISKTKFKFKSTSALRTDTNIDDIFNEIAEDIMENYLSNGDKEQKLKLLKKYTKPKNNSKGCFCKVSPEV